MPGIDNQTTSEGQVTLGSPDAVARRPGDGRKGDVSNYQRYLSDFIGNTSQNRKQQVIDVQYYHGVQLTAEEIRTLEKRRQPVLIINRYRAAINGYLGVIAQKKTQPRAYPRTPNDEDSADVATDTLRFLQDSTQLKDKLLVADQDLLTAGVAGVILGVDKKTGKITVDPIAWNELIYDPRSRKHDFSDAKYMGVAKWAYTDDVQNMYPDANFDLADVNMGSFGGNLGLNDVAGEDRPRYNVGWISADKKRVLVVELHYLEKGQWWKAVFTGAGVLEEGLSWLNDQYGNTICPIVAETIYVDDDNNRMGVGRDMRYIQDEINKRRSKLLHLLSVAQIQATQPNAVEVDATEARDEAARPDGVIPFGWERVRNQDIVQGQQLLLAESKSEIERMGPNPAIVNGRANPGDSGDALAMRQQAGMVELALVFSRMDNLEIRVFRMLWLVAQQNWTAPMWVRVTDDVDDPRFVMINQPVMGQVPGVNPETGDPAIHPDTGAPVMVNDVLGYTNRIAELDVDIILDVVADTATLQSEQLKMLMDLIARNPAYAQQVPPQVLFELTPIPRKREILKMIQQATQQQQQQQAQQQQIENQIQMQMAGAKIADVQSRATLNNAKAQEAGANAASYAAQVQGQNSNGFAKIVQTAQDKFMEHALVRRAQDLQQQTVAQDGQSD